MSSCNKNHFITADVYLRIFTDHKNLNCGKAKVTQIRLLDFRHSWHL